MQETVQELFIDRGKLVSKELWEQRVDELEQTTGPFSTSSLDSQKTSWFALFEEAILTRVNASVLPSKDAPIGVFFSGGVDSSFIALILHKHHIPFICYTVGFKDPGTKEPEDIVVARRVAAQFGWQHKERVLTLEELKPIVDETAKILGDVVNPITVSVGAVILAATRLAQADGVNVFFGGLGSEEIFAGYERHDRAADIHSECWRGLRLMYERDLLRDAALIDALAITVWTPFLDSAVIMATMRIPASEKIKGDDKKYILREIALDAGLPREFAFRPKRAAQYGSRINKGILRLAWSEGLEKKGEYLERVTGLKISRIGDEKEDANDDR